MQKFRTSSLFISSAFLFKTKIICIKVEILTLCLLDFGKVQKDFDDKHKKDATLRRSKNVENLIFPNKFIAIIILNYQLFFINYFLI